MGYSNLYVLEKSLFAELVIISITIDKESNHKDFS